MSETPVEPSPGNPFGEDTLDDENGSGNPFHGSDGSHDSDQNNPFREVIVECLPYAQIWKKDLDQRRLYFQTDDDEDLEILIPSFDDNLNNVISVSHTVF